MALAGIFERKLQAIISDTPYKYCRLFACNFCSKLPPSTIGVFISVYTLIDAKYVTWGVHSTPVCQHTYDVLAHQKAKVCYAHQNKGVLAHHMHYYIALKLGKHMYTFIA